jgi:hypothetical protein
MELGKIVNIRVNLSKIKVREGFIIPQPESGEPEEKYIKRCMDVIRGEYDTPEQAVAVCYGQLQK